MARDGYKTITIRDETHDRLVETKAEGATWDAYLNELLDVADAATTPPDRSDFSVSREHSPTDNVDETDTDSPVRAVVVDPVELTDAERDRLVNAFERRLRDLGVGADPY